MHKVTQYEGHDAENGQVIEVTVGYSKGGMSYATGNKIPRGIYLNMQEVTLEKTEYGTSTSYMMFGTGWLLEPLTRGNPKKLLAWAELLDEKMPAACAAFRELTQADLRSMGPESLTTLIEAAT